jgi:hypothetical protein
MRYPLTFVLSLCAVMTFFQVTSAQTTPKEVTIYNGDLLLSPYLTGRSLGAWGGGEAKEVENVRYEKAAGIKSVEVLTNNLYDGMRLDLNGSEAFDITPFTKDGHIVIRAMFQQSCQLGGGRGGGPGMPGTPGGPGGFGAGGTTQPKEPKIFKHLRVVMYLEQGAIGVDRWKVDFEDVDEKGWATVDIPLSAFKPQPLPGGKVKRILISGDAPKTKFWVGQIRLVIDHGPMSVRILANGKPAQGSRLKLDEDIEFVADVDYGTADVLVLWDFDEDDGIDDRVVGNPTTPLMVKRKFGGADDYKITVTVIDLRYRKPPLTVQVEVKVG